MALMFKLRSGASANERGAEKLEKRRLSSHPPSHDRKSVGYGQHKGLRADNFCGTSREAEKRTVVFKRICIATNLAALHIVSGPLCRQQPWQRSTKLRNPMRCRSLPLTSNCSTTFSNPPFMPFHAKMLQKSKCHRRSSRKPHSFVFMRQGIQVGRRR